jgi:hypothetical protein
LVSEFPGRPPLKKGALVVYQSQDPGSQPSVTINFQYNPEQLRRTLASRTPQRSESQSRGSREDALRVSGPPQETINISITIDATGQIGSDDASDELNEHGILPVLANLELLLYPNTEELHKIDAKARESGSFQVNPANTPLTLLVWDRFRAVPVQLTSFSITEELFDPNLNPIRAKVDLGLKVLTYMEFPSQSIARDTYMSYQQRKEDLAGKMR